MPAGLTLKALPNVLSFSRLVLAAGFVAADGVGMRVGLIGAAAATDFLDGWLARRVNAASRWGALIDPIADRFFVLTAVATMLFSGALTTAQYFVLIARDLATAVGFLVARVVSWLKPVEFRARWLGKVVTALQLAALVAALVAPRLVMPLVIALAVTSAAAITDYTLALWRARAT
ncbi:MAG TPA: CDP-alcohol phosphatidyltransferase family protein [Gemmatimonadaceae bacterium]|nr:CDP-alcohol phosphatidyltransferase family protein [Gemmatimonadaceae bacterium]